jgi:glycosyltransferase involved in cell wall biosynthesis
MPAPRVTVIVATRNRPEWLSVSLQSILASAAVGAIKGILTRVLVVDDASTSEATKVTCDRLGVDYLRNPVHDGRTTPSTARVLGIANVETPYFAFFDDDDFMLPRFIPLHVDALEAGHDVCSTAFWLADDDLEIRRKVVPMPATIGDLLAGFVAINDQSLIRTDIAQDVTWDPDLENVMMYAAWMQMMARGRSFHLITEPTFLYRRHHRNTSDQLGSRDVALRRKIRGRYRQLFTAHNDGVPAPTPRWRRLVWRARHAVQR